MATIDWNPAIWMLDNVKHICEQYLNPIAERKTYKQKYTQPRHTKFALNLILKDQNIFIAIKVRMKHREI